MATYINLFTTKIPKGTPPKKIRGAMAETKEDGSEALDALNKAAEEGNVKIYEVTIVVTGNESKMRATAYGTAVLK